MYEREYNAISPKTALRFARALRRRGYQVRQRRQWVYVLARSLDQVPGMLARYYGAIAY